MTGTCARGLRAVLLATTCGLALHALLPSAARAEPFTEFQVNTYTYASYQDRPAICAGDAGFVVVWTDDREYDQVFGRRLDSFGSPLGSEFRVNSLDGISITGFPGVGPKIACGLASNFVVAWTDYNHDTGVDAVVARRFDSLANPIGADFVVSSYTADYQGSSNIALAMDPFYGFFVVAWDDQYRSGDYRSVFAQLFYDNGTELSGEFQVNTSTSFDQGGVNTDIAAAFDSNGNFVVTWGGYRGNDYDVFAQRFYFNGLRLGAEFLVNTHTVGEQGANIAVAGDTSGGFVIVWTGDTDGDGLGVFGRRFASTGAPVGTEFQVNTATAGGQGFAYGYQNISVASDPDGGFVVVWDDDGSTNLDGSYSGIFARRFASDGQPVGSQFQVNTYTVEEQFTPVVAVNGGGSFVVAWVDSEYDGYGHGIFAATPTCPAAPLNTCTTAAKSLFSLSTVAGDPSKSKLIWKWIKGDALFVDPISGANYGLCVYDDGSLALSYGIGAGPGWVVSGTGFKFKELAGNDSGIRQVKMKPGTGKAKIIVKGGLDKLAVPSSDPLFTQSSELRVQFVRVGTSDCWEGIYPTPAVKNTGLKFKDKS